MAPRSLVAGAAAIALALPLTVAADDTPVGTAAFNELSVEVVDGEVVVEGSASFGGELITVGADPAGDATVPIGVDITDLTIQQTDDFLEFTMHLGDALPGIGSPPVGSVYRWPLTSASGGELYLGAWPANALMASPTWAFTLITDTPDGFLEDPIDGEFTGSALVWRISTAAAGLQPGDVYNAFGPAATDAGFAGALMVYTGWDTAMVDKFMVGGGAFVTVYDADGEEVDEVDARVRRDTFSATIKDLEPGTYRVDVTTGYGDARVTESFDVTI